jgi:hypothetical protein
LLLSCFSSSYYCFAVVVIVVLVVDDVVVLVVVVVFVVAVFGHSLLLAHCCPRLFWAGKSEAVLVTLSFLVFVLCVTICKEAWDDI